MLTKPRCDLPEVGDSIAVLHGCGQWYYGALTVLTVDAERRHVEARPEYSPVPGAFVFDAKLGALEWNLVSDLSPDEQAQMRHAPDPGAVAEIEKHVKDGIVVIAGRVSYEISGASP